MVTYRALLTLPLLLALASIAGEKKSLPELESKYYRIITLPTPKDVQFESGALMFLGSLSALSFGRLRKIPFVAAFAVPLVFGRLRSLTLPARPDVGGPELIAEGAAHEHHSVTG